MIGIPGRRASGNEMTENDFAGTDWDGSRRKIGIDDL
jgi:hypothetical protein